MSSSSLRCANSAAQARAFVQLAKRHLSSTTTPARSNAPLDFLLPHGGPSPPPTPSSIMRDGPLPRVRWTAATGPLRWQETPRRRSHNVGNARLRRHLSTTSARCATICVQNPHTDEEGNSMILEITPRAAKRLSEIMVKDGNPDLALRIQVESGGCHGFQYLMSLITLPAKDATADPSQSSPLFNEDDSIFEYVPDDSDAASSSWTKPSPRIILDEASLDLLKGSKVDFTMELIGSQFKIVDNPYAVSSCGCGTSFDIKM